MALSQTDIDINCKQGYHVADQLKNAGDELRAEYHDYHSVVEGVRASWTGENARRFAAKLEETEEKVYAQVQNLYDLADAIRQTVNIYREQQYELNRQERESKNHTSSSGASHSGGGRHI